MPPIRPLSISFMSFISFILFHGIAGAHASERVSASEETTAQVSVPADTRAMHTVAEGETLAAIAKQFYNTERQLRFHNLLPEPQATTPGLQLRIPDPGLRVPADWERQYAEGRLAGHEMAVHKVGRGESLSLIANSYDLDAELLQNLNELDNPYQLAEGDILRLPTGAQMQHPVVVVPRFAIVPVTRDTPIGAYVVARGDTLSLIADQHGVKVGQILAVNTLADPDLLEIGDRLLVPDPHRLLPPAAPPSEYTFMWPLDDYRVVSEYGGRGDREHRGIDMAAMAGSPIRASAEGVVVFVGEQQGYGKVVIVEHGAGVQTLYAHNTRNLVQRGQEVLQGQAIATVGLTGNARGNHLHFEYIIDGDSKEPRDHIESILRADG
jgi:murein DD-endopeptidase MepM/ murein hydrolase activator NlpD